jgi:ABC-type lipoprotein release transport system permease subunit
MSLFTLIKKEISHRKFNFLLSLLAVAVAASAILASRAFLKASNLETTKRVDAHNQETADHLKKLDDDIRKSMKAMGFNIYIYPKDQDMSEVYAKGYASKTMPEDYVVKLANSKLMTVNHLLPTLTQKMEWPEEKRTIILIGVRGQVPLSHKNPKKPIQDPVAPGDIVLGYELHNQLGLKKGDELTLMGRRFTVSKTHAPRGTTDDITAWINLGICQEILDKKGQINSILALECNCATIDRLGEIRTELNKVLPDIRIEEVDGKAVARAEARNKAKETRDAQLITMQNQRIDLEEQQEVYASIAIPFIAIIVMSGICLLTFMNVKDRLYEVGLLLALGVKTSKILLSFLIKACIGGLLGGCIGIVLAFAVVCLLRQHVFHGFPVMELMSKSEILLILVSMPLFAAISAWIPSFWAAQQDPAEILRHD